MEQINKIILHSEKDFFVTIDENKNAITHKVWDKKTGQCESEYKNLDSAIAKCKFLNK